MQKVKMKGFIQKYPNRFYSIRSGYKVLKILNDFEINDNDQLFWKGEVYHFNDYQLMEVDFNISDIHRETMTSIVVKDITNIKKTNFPSKLELILSINREHRDRFISKYRKSINDFIVDPRKINTLDVISMNSISSYDKDLINTLPAFLITDDKLEYLGEGIKSYSHLTENPYIYLTALCKYHRIKSDPILKATSLTLEVVNNDQRNLVFLKFKL